MSQSIGLHFQSWIQLHYRVLQIHNLGH
jgi:hypothetical protein